MSQVTAVILAAGEGKRMRSRQPKVLHPLCGRPLIAYPRPSPPPPRRHASRVRPSSRFARSRAARRIARKGGRVKRIVEERDATAAEKKIAEINTSVYCFAASRLWPALDRVRPDNDQ